VALSSTAGRNFGERIATYVAGRPDYPVQLLHALPVAEARFIVDLGAGTGKFTRMLPSGTREITAVEPDPAMAVEIESGRGGGAIKVVCAFAERLPFIDGYADLVCCATAFHWFDCARATAEIYRLLRPGGHLALMWNIRDDRTGWVAEVSRLLDRHAGETPRYSSGRWRAILSNPHFTLVKEESYPFSHQLAVKSIKDRVLSTSFIAGLGREEQDQVCADVDRIIEEDETLRTTETAAFPYVCELYLFRRIP
jgi:SAM-dependent methyltransferase